MDPGDFFRNLFGFHNPHQGNPSRHKGFIDDNDDNNDECYDWEGDGSHGIDDVFRHFHDEMQKQMGELQHQMEDMFKNFGIIEFPPAIMPPNGSEKPENPRDHMLKNPDKDPDSSVGGQVPVLRRDIFEEAPSLFGREFSVPRWNRLRPQDKVDKDLDGEISDKNIGKLFEKPPHSQLPAAIPESPRTFSRHGSVSVTTIRGADGKVEQRKKVRDSDGREETTVTRKIGDKSHTVISKKDDTGVETIETFQNLSEKDLPSFENQWENKGRESENPRDLMIIPSQDQKNSGSDRSIFKKLFDFDFGKSQ